MDNDTLDIQTNAKMNLTIKDLFKYSPEAMNQYALKRIEELEALSEHVGFVDDAWYACQNGICESIASGAIIKSGPRGCPGCGRTVTSDYKFLRMIK